MNNFTADAFWQFSLTHYLPYQAEFLWLQDTAKVNVNLALCIFFVLDKGYFLSHSNISALLKSIEKLDSLTANFRNQRRLLKEQGFSNDSNRYQKALAEELQLEKQQQEQLIQCLNQMKNIAFRSQDLSQSSHSELFKRIVEVFAAQLGINNLDCPATMPEMKYQLKLVLKKLYLHVFNIESQEIESEY